MRAEHSKRSKKNGPPPPHIMGEWRYVKLAGWDYEQIKRTPEQWGVDILAVDRWSNWVQNDELERMRKDGPKKEPRQATKQALEDHALRLGPQYRDVPAEAMAFLTGMEMVDEG